MDYRRATKDTFLYFDLKIKLASYNKLLKKTMREAKCSYYNQEFENNKYNIRRIWGTINEIICWTKNNGHGIKSILINNHIKTNEPKMIVDKLNEFVNEIGANLFKHVSQTTQKDYCQSLNTTILTSFNFLLTREFEVKKIIRALKTKTSSGHDGFFCKAPQVFNACPDKNTNINNQSITTLRYFPRSAKSRESSSFVPKRRQPHCWQLSSYLSAFLWRSIWIQRKALHRISNPRINGLNNLSSRSKKKLPSSIFMDLSKVFDTFSHEILLKKKLH